MKVKLVVEMPMAGWPWPETADIKQTRRTVPKSLAAAHMCFPPVAVSVDFGDLCRRPTNYTVTVATSTWVRGPLTTTMPLSVTW